MLISVTKAMPHYESYLDGGEGCVRSIGIFQGGLEDKSLEFVEVNETVFLDCHCIVEFFDDNAVRDAKVMVQLWGTEFAASLNHIILLDLATLLEVKVLEKRFHLLEEAAVHENSANATQEFIKINIFFFTFVE